MKLELKKKPKNVTILEGFPGFGLIGTITTEYLIEKLDCEFIGSISMEELPAMIAIHQGKVVNPLGIFYNKKYNLVILHAITSPKGLEWKLTDALLKLVKELDAKEVVSIEGVGNPKMDDDPKIYFYSNNKKKTKKFESLKIEPLKEGIIMGVTSTLLLKLEKSLSCLFVETHSKLPDSKASAKIVEILDKYFGFDIDTKPLLKSAEEFESKLKTIMANTHHSVQENERKKMSYVG